MPGGWARSTEKEHGGPYGQARRWAFIHCGDPTGGVRPGHAAAWGLGLLGAGRTEEAQLRSSLASPRFPQTTKTEHPAPHPLGPPVSHYPHAPNSDSHNKTVNSWCTWATIIQTACDIKNLRSIYFQYRGCRNVAALFKELFGVCGCLSELLLPVAEAGLGDRYMQLGS